MEYQGKLYAKYRGQFIELSENSEDIERIKKRNIVLEKVNKSLSEKNSSLFEEIINQWVKITGEEDFPKYYDTILLNCLNSDNEGFFSLGHYDHSIEKYILDFGTAEQNKGIKITHYSELINPE